MFLFLFLISDNSLIAVANIKTGKLLYVSNYNTFLKKRFPIGSIAKIFAYLYMDKNDFDTLFTCKGYNIIGQKKYLCSINTGHGKISKERALILSCNNFFLSFFDKKRIHDLKDFILKFHIYEKSSWDMGTEIPTLINSWQREIVIGKNFYQTPAYLLALISGIANNGNVPWLYVDKNPGEIHYRIPANVEHLKELLHRVVLQGTAKGTNRFLAGKTGSPSQKANYITHGWFIGFYPFYAPHIAIVVFIHNGTGKQASIIASHYINKYYK